MKIIIPVFFLLLSVPVCSQNKTGDSAITCLAHWKKGESRVYTIVHNKFIYSSGKLTSKINLVYEAWISVLDETKTGYKMQWVFHLPDSFKKENPGVAESLPVYEGMKMIFTLNREGTFVDLLNWEEVSEAYVKMMEVSLPKDMDSTQRALVKKSTDFFHSKDMVEAALIPEITIFHFPYGGYFSKNERKVNTEIQNQLFGDTPLPAVQTIQLTDLNPQSDFYKVSIKQTINMAGAEGILKNFLKGTDVPVDSVIAETKKVLEHMDINQSMEFRVSQSTGWPQSVNLLKTANTQEKGQREVYQIRLK